ncbi:MAG TPA: sensor histidine kinase [Cyclobacteriaceae bacterium]|nr:sensor histidine kinase [Cyclobacteriaceae bacterium]
MAARFLYLLITVGYLVHWIHDDHVSTMNEFWVSLLENAWQVVYVMGMNILYFEYVLPFAMSGIVKRWVGIVVSILMHLSVLAFGLYAWRLLGASIGIYTSNVTLSNAFQFAPGVFIVFAVVKLFYDYTQLKYEGKQAELLFLKSQINPHFLFNTLNNIYSLSQYQPQLVSESVLRLSKILRYLLYEASSQFITIDKEIKILTDYIDLEKLRYSDSVTIDFNFEIDDHSEVIPPLLLLPLVENAFKHGVSVARGKRFVNVQCVLKNKKLHFIVKNSSFTNTEYEETKDNIGLSNLRRRLDLMYKKFEFVTEQKESTFTAELTINLASHV